MTPRWAGIARKFAWVVVLTTVAMTPLVISPGGDDWFRLPKLLFFQVLTLFVAALVSVLAIYDSSMRRNLLEKRFVIFVAAAAVAWSGVVTVFSRKPVVSHDAPFTVFCYALFFVMAVALARPPAWLALGAVFLPAAVTAMYAIAQFLKLRTPFIAYDPGGTRHQVIALLGNPNYVATFLLVPLVAAIAAISVWPRYAALLIPLSAFIFAAVLASLTVTILVALGGAVIALLFTVDSMKFRLVFGIVLLLAVAGVASFGPARHRALVLARQLSGGDHAALTSQRLPAFAAATMMFRERPLLGVGPGVFGADYMPYRVAVDRAHPDWNVPANLNFGEVHNDHLQLLSEGGVPAYALFLALIVRTASISLKKRRAHDPQERFVQVIALPLSVGFVIAAMAQFPMQLAASAVVSLFMAGLCFSWEPSAE